MERDLLQELVLGFLVLRDFVALRIASMVVHEAMMDTALDLWDMDEPLTFNQARALARLTKLHKFKLAPARCLCAAAKAVERVDFGAMVTDTGVASQDLLGLGLGRSWRLTGLRLRGEVSVGEFKQLLGDSFSATTITKLRCDITDERGDEEEDEDERLDLSSVSHLSLLTHLELHGYVSGDGCSLQNFTNLQHLDLEESMVSCSPIFLQSLTQLRHLNLSNTQVSGRPHFLRNLTQLQQLGLGSTQVSCSLSLIQSLTQLQRLDLTDTQVFRDAAFR